MDPLDIAIAKAGGVGRLAEKIGIGQSAVSNWRKRGRVPVEQCPAVESATDGAVTRYALRPDVFGDAPEQAA